MAIIRNGEIILGDFIDSEGGGGGSALVPSMTQAEYDALSDEEKMNGQIREITDATESSIAPFAVVSDEMATTSNVWTAKKTKDEVVKSVSQMTVTEYVTFPIGTSVEEILKQLCERSTNNKSYVYNVINEGWGFTLTVVLSNRSGFCCGTATNTYDNYAFRMRNTDRTSFVLKKLALTENIFDARQNNTTDCNKQVESGVFTVNPSTLNQPYSNYGILFVYGENSDKASGNDQWVYQRLETTSGYIYIRRTINPNSLTPPAGAWSDWQELALARGGDIRPSTLLVDNGLSNKTQIIPWGDGTHIRNYVDDNNYQDLIWSENGVTFRVIQNGSVIKDIKLV